MAPGAVEAAGRADRNAQPLAPGDLKRMKRTPQAKIIRRALALTHEEFAVRYHIPLGTLRDWEQGRAEPDKPTEACLKVIARAPERIERLLNSRAHRVQLANPTRRKARGEPGTAPARAFTALL